MVDTQQFPNPGWNVLEAVRYRARTAPQRPFLTYIGADGPDSLTNAEVAELVDSTARTLISSGFQPGDVCILHTGNTRDFVVLLLAVIQAGGVAVPTIEMSAPDELAYVIEHSQARLLITTGALHSIARQAAEGSLCEVHLESDLLSPAESATALRLGSAEADCPTGTAILMYTSGTSGRPKGVLLSHSAIDFTVMGYAEHLRLTASDTVLICMPLFHVNGMMLQLLPAIISGSHTVLTPKFSVRNYWRWVEQHRVTVGHLVSGPIRLLLQEESSPRISSMRAMTFGLALTDQEILAFEDRFNAQLLMVWGLTETCCGATLMGLDHRRRSEYQNLGPALRGWSVKVVDETGDELEPGEHGELLVRSPGVMTGYHRDPQATHACLRDGYVATGDLGYVDEEGCVHFVSRIKDMLKPNGENVAAQEIADALTSHDDVEEAAAFGVDDPITVERVIAAIVPSENATVTVSELREHCAGLLASFKVPSEILIVESIPKTSIGKQQVSTLKADFLAGQLVGKGVHDRT